MLIAATDYWTFASFMLLASAGKVFGSDAGPFRTGWCVGTGREIALFVNVGEFYSCIVTWPWLYLGIVCSQCRENKPFRQPVCEHVKNVAFCII